MTEHVVKFYDLSPEVTSMLTKAGAKVTAAADLLPADYASVTVMFGWDASLGNAIIDTSNSQLRWIQSTSAGVDYFPKDKLAALGVTVTNASGVHAEPIAQSVFGDMLYFTRGLNTHVQNTQTHTWNNQGNNMRVLSEFKVLIFGTGHIGAELAQNLQALHVHVTGINHSGRAVAGFDQVYPLAEYQTAVADADIIVNILPGTEETRDFYNAEFFSHVADAFLFINVGRGFSVTNAELIQAVAAKKVRYVALDVANPEPLPADNPLWDIPEVLITSHTTGFVDDYTARLLKIVAANLPSYLADGTFVRNVVDLNKGY
ncbi:phosphoglycerate dehydrogenase [Periweissella cryptocerci]|uniref:Phosphoglycerate dehydrogenase n=1 Tax=Periweissella cryptocerci TaxID=2506420 RepID=A0A4P6YTC4_9LACO|nr:NAD(P)-dependent oxidoreductase [Periweissella cryptocerci]QBO35930.1 phosphoglycerate dehydrogenase [Periweissella cryptocerci]